MATEVVKTIKPSGGDYTSLQAFMVGEARDLVTADEIAVAECYAMEDTTNVVIDGFTTDATRYIKIYTPYSERHDGKWNTSKYRLSVTSGSAIIIEGYNVVIEGLQIYSANSKCFDVSIYSTVTGYAKLSHSILKGGSGTYDTCIGIRGLPSGSSFDLTVSNNLIYDSDGSGQSGFYSTTAYANLYIYNNTFHNCARGIRLSYSSSGQEHCKNNLISSADAFYGTFTDDDDNNDYNSISQNSNDPSIGSHGRYNQTFTFVDYDNDDFHLASNDAGALGYGVDLSSDPNFPVTDDIDGDARDGSTPDIGADEYASATTGNPWYYYAQQ